jgi:hypothetical protein
LQRNTEIVKEAQAATDDSHHEANPIKTVKTLAFTAPILRGKTEDARRFVKEIAGPRYQQMTDSRKALGQTRETVWIQPTPMGDFLVVYLEGADPVRANQALAASQNLFDLWFKQQAQGFTGIDFNQPLPEGFSKAIYESHTPGATNNVKTLAVALPLLPDQTDAYLRFVEDVKGPRQSDMEAFHRRVGIVVENWYLQHTPQGDLVVVYIEGDVPRAFQIFAESKHAFDTWLKNVWLATEGVDFNKPLSGVPELGFDWRA